MAQFRVEFVLDRASGKYRVEMYHPDRDDELLVRTEPVFATQEAGVLGVVQLFKGAIPKQARSQKKKRPSKARKAQARKTRKTKRRR